MVIIDQSEETSLVHILGMSADNVLWTSPRLLLVDDDDAILETLGLFLEYSGFETVMARGLNDALSLISSRKFDVLVSDLNLPEPGAGWRVVSAMRSSNINAVTIIFSANLVQKNIPEVGRSQTDVLLAKPSSATVMADTIRLWLSHKRSPCTSRPGLSDLII